MIIIDSARKHNISDQDITFVYETANKSLVLQQEDGPPLTLLFGFDTIGRGLEVGYVINAENEIIVIHAMKIRPHYKNYLYG